MFVLNSDITAGNFRFTGVHEVVVRRSIYSIVESATITLPAIAAVSESGKKPTERIATASRFKPGEAVSIALGYNGELKEEFRGFVKEVVTGTPLKVVCEGSSLLMRRNRVSTQGLNTLKEHLGAVVAGLSPAGAVSVVCNDDFELVNLLPKGPSGFDLLNAIREATDNVLSCFFPSPGVLWCGLLHNAMINGQLPGIDQVTTFKLGFNALRESALTPVTYAPAGKVQYARKKNNGETLSHTAGKNQAGEVSHEKTLNHVAEKMGLSMLAEEKLKQLTSLRLEGHFVAFLQPYVAPGNAVYIEGDNNVTTGTYLVESTEVTFGIGGARRKIEAGAALKVQ